MWQPTFYEYINPPSRERDKTMLVRVCTPKDGREVGIATTPEGFYALTSFVLVEHDLVWLEGIAGTEHLRGIYGRRMVDAIIDGLVEASPADKPQLVA